MHTPVVIFQRFERVVGFFYFCMRMKWIAENTIKSLHPPKVKQVYVNRRDGRAIQRRYLIA